MVDISGGATLGEQRETDAYVVDPPASSLILHCWSWEETEIV